MSVSKTYPHSPKIGLGSMQLVTEEPFEPRPLCLWPNCNKSFTQINNLKRHYLTHRNVRLHACHHPGCGKRFNRKDELIRHTGIHAKEKPYQCRDIECGKTFTTSSSRNRHEREFHTNDDLVNNQSTSHRQGFNGKDVEGSSSSSVEKESPSTPQHSSMTWLPKDVPSMGEGDLRVSPHRAFADADLKLQVHDRHIPPDYAQGNGNSMAVCREDSGHVIRDQQMHTELDYATDVYESKKGGPGAAAITSSSSSPCSSGLSHQDGRPTTEFPISVQSSPSTLFMPSGPRPMAQGGLYLQRQASQLVYGISENEAVPAQYHEQFQHSMLQPSNPALSHPESILAASEYY